MCTVIKRVQIEKSVLDFFNRAKTTGELVNTVIDDPKTGRISKKTYGIRASTAKKVLEARERLTNKKFTSISQIRNVPGIGADTINDLYFTFGIKAALNENNIEAPIRDKEAILKEIDDSLELDNEIKRKIDEYVSNEFKDKKIKIKELKAASNEAFEKLDLSSSKNKEGFVKADFDHIEVLRKASQNKVNSLKNTRGLTANLSVNMMKALGFTQDLNDGSFSGKGDVKKFEEVLNDDITSEGTLKSRLDTLISQCKVELESSRLVEDAFNDESSIEDDDESCPDNLEPQVPSTESNLEKLLGDKLAIQMQYSSSPENQVLFNVQCRENPKQISKSIKKIQFSPGPADVPAFHDFYNLNIAFEHVWTEYFDETLVDAAKGAFEEWTELAESDKTADIPDDYKSGKSQNLKSFVKDYKNLNKKIAESDPRFNQIRIILSIPMPFADWLSLNEMDKVLFGIYITNYQRKMDEIKIWEEKNITKEMEWIRRNAISRLEKDADRIRKAAIRIWIKVIREKNRRPNIREDPSSDPDSSDLINNLEDKIKSEYSFKIFAPNSINFGIVINYRQKWTPLNYQVGELVSTIPLAPGETRSYTKKMTVKKTRAEKELEETQITRSIDSKTTGRADSQIVRNASLNTNFQHAGEFGFNYLQMYNAKANHSMSINAAKSSADTKKVFREAVLKSAQTYKENHKLEISTEVAEEEEYVETGKIVNPNDELTLTCLFYELQRRYKIQEKLHSIRPVILVANEMPKPSDINVQFVLEHSWILKQVILADSFLPAIDYIREGYAASKLEIAVLEENLEKQKDVVDKVTEQVNAKSEAVKKALDLVKKAVEESIDATDEGIGGVFGKSHEFFFGRNDDPKQAAQIRENFAKETFERLQQEANVLREQLRQEVSVLNEATEKYTEALKEEFSQKTAIIELLIHIKQNILYYMQAIWSFENPDKTFFRLYDLEVPFEFVPESNEIRIKDKQISRMSRATDPRSLVSNHNSSPSNTMVEFPSWKLGVEKKKLVEVADLDNLLGFKGNYMIFPLKESNFLTNFMMKDYVDVDGIVDPDAFTNYTIEEVYDLIKSCAKNKPELLTDEVKKQFEEIIIEKRSSPRVESDEIVIPTDSLYIEALPGARPVLEDFKLIHRAVDVKKAQAEVREQELDNIRRANKILKGELEDPEIEKQIMIKGDNVKTVTDVTDEEDPNR